MRLWHVPRLANAKWELVDGVHFVVQHIATEVSRIIVNVYKQRALQYQDSKLNKYAFKPLHETLRPRRLEYHSAR